MITAEEQINDLKDVWKTLPEGSRKAKVDWNRKKGKMSTLFTVVYPGPNIVDVQ